MKARIFGAGSIGNHLSNALRKLKYEVEVIDIDQLALLRMKNEIYPSRYGEWDHNIKLLDKPSEEFVDIEIKLALFLSYMIYQQSTVKI